MDGYLSASVGPRRFNLLVLAVFGVAALLLAAIGIYAMIAYSVSQRFDEIRIRMALGAALVVARTLSGLLFGMSAADSTTFTVVAVGVASVALMACVTPAMRATRRVAVDQISR